MPGWAAISIVVTATVIGVAATLVLRQEPGATLGVAVFAGTVIAGLGANYRAAYLIIPVPALAYLVAACASGYLHDKSVIVGHFDLAAHSAEWIGNGFSWMLFATIAAIVVVLGRWLWARQDMLRGGTSSGSGAPRPGPRGPGGPRPGTGGRRPDPRRDNRGQGQPDGPGYAPSYARPAAGYARSSSNPRPGDAVPQRADTPPPLPLDPPGGARPALGTPPRSDQRPGNGDEDPFRRYYDSGDSWR